LTVGLRPCPVEGAAMPETTVNEYNDSLASEHHVPSSSQTGYERDVDPVSEPTAVQLSSKGELGSSISATGPLHPSAGLG